MAPEACLDAHAGTAEAFDERNVLAEDDCHVDVRGQFGEHAE
ncbi:MAG TPA: hypothetical protein VJ838_09740 [Gaiellaceae bacterium]|nr:hypothetical protein [Gaiellaceae bacterium]